MTSKRALRLLFMLSALLGFALGSCAVLGQRQGWH
jgi:hypothetical protein